MLKLIPECRVLSWTIQKYWIRSSPPGIGRTAWTSCSFSTSPISLLPGKMSSICRLDSTVCWKIDRPGNSGFVPFDNSCTRRCWTSSFARWQWTARREGCFSCGSEMNTRWLWRPTTQSTNPQLISAWGNRSNPKRASRILRKNWKN